jgi:hypothetical protein
MRYHYVWLVWSVLFLLPWAWLYLANPGHPKVMWHTSLVIALLGFTEPIYVPVYWNPPSLFELAQRTGFDIESLIFAFAIGGIGSAPPDIILIATGSEVQLALAAREKLETQGVRARLVSLPCWNLFDAQPVEYREAVLPLDVLMLAIEAGVSLGWRPYVGPGIEVIGVDCFGASAPGEIVMREYGFSVDHVTQRALALVTHHKKA